MLTSPCCPGVLALPRCPPPKFPVLLTPAPVNFFSLHPKNLYRTLRIPQMRTTRAKGPARSTRAALTRGRGRLRVRCSDQLSPIPALPGSRRELGDQTREVLKQAEMLLLLYRQPFKTGCVLSYVEVPVQHQKGLPLSCHPVNLSSRAVTTRVLTFESYM